jgi:hypothetical protein
MKLKGILASAAIAGVALAFAGSACAVPDKVFDFTGACTDCTGDGLGVLTLTGDYQLGDVISTSNFVSFSYSSNLVPSYITILAADAPSMYGILSTVPGEDSVYFQTGNNQQYFYANKDGNWCVGNACDDYGSSHLWTVGTAGVPEPSNWALMIAGTSMAGGVLRSARRRSATAS